MRELNIFLRKRSGAPLYGYALASIPADGGRSFPRAWQHRRRTPSDLLHKLRQLQLPTTRKQRTSFPVVRRARNQRYWMTSVRLPLEGVLPPFFHSASRLLKYHLNFRFKTVCSTEYGDVLPRRCLL